MIAGVGFANYDTLYALAWGGQLGRGSTPAYGTPIAPTPHPLVEALGNPTVARDDRIPRLLAFPLTAFDDAARRAFV